MTGVRVGVPLILAIASLVGCSSDQTTLATIASPSSGSSSSANPSVTTSTPAAPTPAAPTPAAPTASLEGADLVKVGVAPPPDPTQAEAFHAYVEFWQADMAALTRSDPGWQPLLDRVSGQQRTDTVALITANRDKGHRITGSITIRPQVVAVRGDAASIRDCVDLSGTQAVDTSGQPVDGTRGKAGLEYSATMIRQGSTWTVSNIDAVQGPGCAG